MAHTTEDAKLVWLKVKAACDSLGIRPSVVESLRKLKEELSNLRGNPNLKFTPIDAQTDGSDGGNADTVISDTANTALIALVLKKRAGTTAGYPSIANHASAIQAGKELLLASGVTASKQFEAIYPKGKKYATGMTYASVTAYNGTTHNAVADACDGFAISIDAEIA